MKPSVLFSSVAALTTITLASGHFDSTSYAKEDVITRDIIVVGGGALGTHAAITLGPASGYFDPTSYAEEDIITCDIIVVGGGASGTHAAITLGDMGKSVVLVDRAGRLGGHVNTYTNSNTSKTIDSAFLYNTIATNLFDRLNIPMVTYYYTSRLPAYFTSGTNLSNNTPQGSFGAAYIAQLGKYPYLNNGFHLPDSFLKDLQMTWGEYIEKYKLVPMELEGSGEPLDILALYVFNGINSYLASETDGAAVMTAAHDHSALYQRTLAESGTKVLLNSTIVAGERHINSGVKLLVSTPTGPKVLIASQIVLGIPPILSNMQPFLLYEHEHLWLSRICGCLYYCGLVSDTGLPPIQRYTNAGTNTQHDQPRLLGDFWIYPTAVEGIFLYRYGSLTRRTQAEVESSVATIIHGLQETTENAIQGITLVFIAFANHSPHYSCVFAEAVRKDLFSKLFALYDQYARDVGALSIVFLSQFWDVVVARFYP